jgi:hypothetical protein
MGTAATPTRDPRPIPSDCRAEATECRRRDDGKAGRALGLACILSLGFQLPHQARCHGGGCLTRHAHDGRVRLGGVTLWRRQCTRGKAVLTIRPQFVWRYRARRPEGAREALWAPHGGRSVALCAGMAPLSPLALDRLIGALGPQSRVTGLLRWGLPLPVSGRGEATHRRCLPNQVSWPPLVSGRGLWHRGSPKEASAAALTPSYQAFQRAASQPAPS